jgi:hypothetical protein
MQVENCPNLLAENHGLKATGLPKEVAAAGHSITNFKDLFDHKHGAKRPNLVHCRGMTMLTGRLNFALGFEKLGGIAKWLHGCSFL